MGFESIKSGTIEQKPRQTEKVQEKESIGYCVCWLPTSTMSRIQEDMQDLCEDEQLQSGEQEQQEQKRWHAPK